MATASALAVFLVYLHALLAVASAIRGWETGSGLKYRLTTTLLFREIDSIRSGDVGFRYTGELDVAPVWRDPTDPEGVLLRLQLLSPRLWIKSRKAPEPEGFVEHSSKIEEATGSPFLVLWRNGRISSLFLHSSESISSSNLKRGLASLLQYRSLDDEVQEEDASGLCNVTYASLSPQVMGKRKNFCQWDLPAERHPNPIFQVKLAHTRNSTYELTQNHLPRIVRDEERHRMSLTMRPEVGTTVLSLRTLELLPGTFSKQVVEADRLQDAVNLVNPGFRKKNIRLETEQTLCPDSGCPTLEQSLEETREALQEDVLGTAKSASAFLKLRPVIKQARTEELAKILKSPRNRNIRMQLLDIYGSLSSPAAHKAAMKILRDDEIGDETERYLWALSMSPSPNPEIIQDILKRSEETLQNDKVSETLALTAAAMARHYGSKDMLEKARISLELGLESCTGEECKLKFLRSLGNLQSSSSIPTLLSYAMSRDRATSVAAWKAIYKLPREHITPEITEAALEVFHQVGFKRDTSARTIALDVILRNDPPKEYLSDLIGYLSCNDSTFEVRKYLGQRLQQLSEKDKRFKETVSEILRDLKLNNYNMLAQRGLSTAFTRSFLDAGENQGSLVTVQEVNSGLLKRGIVDVVLRAADEEETVFSLGLFAGGLGSFVSSDSQDDDIATAGMEIEILGVGIRPFVFFSGQGELMGHVWSGTASERTPAFQTIAGLHSFQELVPLAAGFVAEMDVRGAVSFDLAGQIQLSLWSRNAQSSVEMNSGIAIQGGTKVRASFVQSTAEFSVTLEPRLELATDVDFSSNVALCMRLSQPETPVKHQIYKVERINGSRHKLRKTRRIKIYSPGRSYLLNRKNNEMCSRFS